MNNCDFSGYATRNDLACGDGRVIRKMHFRITMDVQSRLFGIITIRTQKQ